jgi:hypothetical protein
VSCGSCGSTNRPPVANAPVTVRAVNLPAGITASDVELPEGMNDGALRLRIGGDAAIGNFQINVTATSGAVSRTVAVTVSVAASQPRLDRFEANGCVAQVNPRTATVDATNGILQVDYTVTPPIASGSGGGGPIATLTDCQGRQELVPFAVVFMDGQVALNEQEDTIEGHYVQEDQVSVRKLDFQYKREFDKDAE